MRRPEPEHRPFPTALVILIVVGLLTFVGLTLGVIYVIGIPMWRAEQQLELTHRAIVQAATATPADTNTPVPTFKPLSSQTPSPTPTPTIAPTFTATVKASATPIPTNPPLQPSNPTPTAGEPAAIAPRCVSVVGDSVANGDAVFEIPGTGYVKAHMGAISAFIAYQFQQRGFPNVEVFNRSSPATGISAPNQPSFFTTPEYAQLLQDNCPFVVVTTWVNDLTGGDPSAHAGALGTLVTGLAARNPSSRIFVMNYYMGSPAPFAASTFASGFTPDRVAAFNNQIAAACTNGSMTAPQITCVDANTAVAGAGGNYLVGQMTKDAFDSGLVTPVTPEEQGMLDAFFGQNPGGLLLGDGVHLNSAGKAALAAYLVARML